MSRFTVELTHLEIHHVLSEKAADLVSLTKNDAIIGAKIEYLDIDGNVLTERPFTARVSFDTKSMG